MGVKRGDSSTQTIVTRFSRSGTAGGLSKGTLMKATLTAVVATGTLMAAITASFGASTLDPKGAIVVGTAANPQPAYVAAPNPGYIAYAGYDAPLPGPGCYWSRMPLYGQNGDVIGWRGRPVAVCSQPRISAEADWPPR